MQAKQRYQKAKTITLIGAAVNGVLGCVKVLGGWAFHSHALVADGVHSFSDLLTDAMVVFASKFSSQDADEMHPYGHQRIETAATLLLSLFLILAGIGIGWDAAYELLAGTVDTPGWWAFPLALFSIAANELLFYVTHRVGVAIQSPLIIANAWHHRSDAASSLVVAVGLFGAILGFSYLDSVAAVIVGALIVKMGVDYGWNSVKELVDTAASPELMHDIEKVITSVQGVKKVHQLRSRLMGKDVFVDVHVLVSPFISVSEGHYIAQHVHRALVKKIQAVQDVTVHIDPEDDETSCPSLHLRNRHELHHELFSEWKAHFPSIEDIVIHYLDGRLLLDVMVNAEETDELALEHYLQKTMPVEPDIQSIRVLKRRQPLLAKTRT